MKMQSFPVVTEVSPAPDQVNRKTEWTTTRHDIRFKFQTIGPDAICPLTWRASDLMDLVMQNSTTEVVVTHRITTVHNLYREFTLQK